MDRYWHIRISVHSRKQEVHFGIDKKLFTFRVGSKVHIDAPKCNKGAWGVTLVWSTIVHLVMILLFFHAGMEVHNTNIRIWIHDQDLAKLEKVVWEGMGHLLIKHTSAHAKIRKFLGMWTMSSVHSELDSLSSHFQVTFKSLSSHFPVTFQSLSSHFQVTFKSLASHFQVT